MNFTLPSYDLWEYLQQSKKSIVMYGMGNGADKILAVCQEYGIEIAETIEEAELEEIMRQINE